MRVFEVLYELSTGLGKGEPGMHSCRVAAPSADWAAQDVAKVHNARVNCRGFWVHAVRELPPGDDQAAGGDSRGRPDLPTHQMDRGRDSPGSARRPPQGEGAGHPRSISRWRLEGGLLEGRRPYGMALAE